MYSYIDLHNITTEETREMQFSFLGSLPSRQIYPAYIMRFVCEWVTFWGQVKGNLPNTGLWLVWHNQTKGMRLEGEECFQFKQSSPRRRQKPRMTLGFLDTCWHVLIRADTGYWLRGRNYFLGSTEGVAITEKSVCWFYSDEGGNRTENEYFNGLRTEW